MSLEPVRRRHVVYVPGYDPRSPRAYYLLFRRELRKFAALNGIKAGLARMGEADPPERPVAEWRLTAEWPAGLVETTIEFLDWHDLASRDFEQGKLRRFLLSLHVLWDALVNGAIAAMWRLNWKFGLFSLYPWAMVLLYGLAAAGLLAGATAAAARLGLPALAGFGLGTLLVYGLSFVTQALDRRFFVWYLVNDWIFTWRHRTGRHPDASERFELFAHHLAKRVGVSDADEILVVGHSSGSFIAITIVARALELDAALGRNGRLTLLTLGANTPIAAAGHDDAPVRRAIAALVPSDRVRWADYYAPQDVLNFPFLDPVQAFGLDLGGAAARNPSVRSALFAEIIAPERYRRQRFRFYDRHFQFIRANDLPGAYDFYRFLAGRERLPWIEPR